MSLKQYVLLPCLLIFIRQLILYFQDPTEKLKIVEENLKNISKIGILPKFHFNNEIVIAAVACGGLDRLEELSVMMKSAVIFRDHP